MADVDVSVLNNSIYYVDVIGRIDSSNASELGDVLTELTAQDNPHLLVGLSSVEYMSSAGLRELVGAFKHAHNKGGDVRLCAPSDRVRDVLTLAGLTSIFQIYDDLDEALDDFIV